MPYDQSQSSFLTWRT